MTRPLTIGILPLGRPTFDVPFAEDRLAAMLDVLDRTGHRIVGPRGLLFDAAATEAALADLRAGGIDRLLILQVTFTDASMTVAAAGGFDVPMAIWAMPEPRLGGRLRLNAFCGLNLASHALGLNGISFGWLYRAPDTEALPEVRALLAGERPAGRLDAAPPPAATEAGRAVAARIRGKRIARIGEHPVGFDTCAYSPDEMRALAGVEVDAFGLDTLFGTARAADPAAVSAIRAEADIALAGLDDVNQQELDRSLRLRTALDKIRAGGGYDAFAIRCWPETFTEYGGAVCGPAAMLGEARVPCACEADVMGALTQLVLQEVAQAPVFLTDLVDMDTSDDTGVVWHCGQAPLSMRDPEAQPRATIHTNRKMPLLFEFPLKPGCVTLMRISRAHGETKMVLAGAEMLKRPMAFTGTSGVLRFDAGTAAARQGIIASGLEHHMALAYGDHRGLLRDTAAAMGLPVLEL
jgi:L-fucose isomerase-like protein